MSRGLAPGEVTGLLHAWCAGDAEALGRLLPLVYGELRRLAHRARRGERPGGLETTALVHEAYLRLCGAQVALRDRAHFFALAARTMRRLLVDEGRARAARKRSRGPGEGLSVPGQPGPVDVLLLDDALRRLTELDERQGRLVELRFFGGLTEEEIGEVLGVSVATVRREWTFARAWLFRALAPEAP